MIWIVYRIFTLIDFLSNHSFLIRNFLICHCAVTKLGTHLLLSAAQLFLTAVSFDGAVRHGNLTV